MLAGHVERGVKAGVVAGLVFGLFVAIVANPLVAFADELAGEAGHDADHHGSAPDEAHHDSTVPAIVTGGASVLAGVLWGILLGGVVFGVAFYFLEPLIPGSGGTKSYLTAAAGFVSASGAPWLILPPQPPGVEHPVPTETRLLIYGGMIAAGVAVCLLAGVLYGRLEGTRGRAVATCVAVLPFGLLAIPAVVSPVAPVAHSLPPELAAGLTGTVVFGQALLWFLLAGTHAHLRRRSADAQPSDHPTTPPDTAVTAD